MVPHTPPFVDGDMSAGNLVTAEWLNWVNERVTDTERFLGFFDASSGDLPPVAFPAAVFLPGDNYEISVAGTLDVVDPVTLLSAPTVVNVGDFIRWVSGSPTNPDGWYHTVPLSTIIASNVGFTPTTNISATNVQAAIEELETEAVLLIDLIAANVGYTPSGDLVAVNVQAALDELEAEKAVAAAETASGTSFAPTGSVLSTDVQNAIEELAVMIGGGGGGGYASSITNVPSGNISSTNVQAALNELDSEKVAKAGDTMTGDLIGTNSYWDILGLGNFVGPGSGNYTIVADGAGALVISDDLTFDVTLKPSGSIIPSSLAVGGTSAPNANSSVDVQGIKPMLLPRLTTAQRTAATGVEGMFCFDTDLNTVYMYTGSAWATFVVSGSPVTSICMACSDETTALTTGVAKITFRMPYAMTLTAVRASLTTAQASGSIFTVDINEGNVSILSTKLTIDNNERTSTTAVTTPVISDTALANDAEITVDIDQIGTSGATGLKVYLIGTI